MLWLAPVPVHRIELRWPEGSAVPPAEAIEVRVYPAQAGWFGLVRDEVLSAPQVAPDGRAWSYTNQLKDTATGKPKDTDMVAVFFDPSKAAAGASSPRAAARRPPGSSRPNWRPGTSRPFRR